MLAYEGIVEFIRHSTEASTKTGMFAKTGMFISKKCFHFFSTTTPPPPQSSHNKKGTTEDNSLIFGHKTEQISDKTLSLLN